MRSSTTEPTHSDEVRSFVSSKSTTHTLSTRRELLSALPLLGRTSVQHLDKQAERLKVALADAQFDRHQLRILVKCTRYLVDTFPQSSPLSSEATASLKTVQSALGSWHDHFQWCLKLPRALLMSSTEIIRCR